MYEKVKKFREKQFKEHKLRAWLISLMFIVFWVICDITFTTGWDYYFYYPEDTYHELYVQANKIIEEKDFSADNIILNLNNEENSLRLTISDTSGTFYDTNVKADVSNYNMPNQEIHITRSYLNKSERIIIVSFRMIVLVLFLTVCFYTVIKYILLLLIEKLCYIFEKITAKNK